jgi:hypothetical protein
MCDLKSGRGSVHHEQSQIAPGTGILAPETKVEIAAPAEHLCVIDNVSCLIGSILMLLLTTSNNS